MQSGWKDKTITFKLIMRTRVNGRKVYFQPCSRQWFFAVKLLNETANGKKFKNSMRTIYLSVGDFDDKITRILQKKKFVKPFDSSLATSKRTMTSFGSIIIIVVVVVITIIIRGGRVGGAYLSKNLSSRSISLRTEACASVGAIDKSLSYSSFTCTAVIFITQLQANLIIWNCLIKVQWIVVS